MTLLSRSLLAGLVLTACATELGAPSASLTPEAPTTADDLVLDVDGAGSAVSVWWYVDDVEALVASQTQLWHKTFRRCQNILLECNSKFHKCPENSLNSFKPFRKCHNSTKKCS